MDYGTAASGVGAMAGGAAGGGAGIIMGGANMAMERQNARKARKIDREQKQRQRAIHSFNINEMEETKDDIADDALHSKASALGNANSRGVLRSSIPMGDHKKIEREATNRIEAINRRQTFENEDMGRTEKIWNWQADMKKNQELMSMINQLINGGLAGYAGA